MVAEVARTGIIKLVDHSDCFDFLKIPGQGGIKSEWGRRRTAGFGSAGVVVEEWDRGEQWSARGGLEHGP